MTRRERLLGGHTVWVAHRKLPLNPQASVEFTLDGHIHIRSWDFDVGNYGTVMILNRRTARLPARRINEALDEYRQSR